MVKIVKRPFFFLISVVLACSGLTGCQLIDYFYLNSKLTSKEKKMPEAKYYNPEFSPLPSDVESSLLGGPIDSDRALKFEDISDLLEPGYLDVENGYCLNPDGTGFVAVKTYFPGATGDMIQWWFWWHANKKIRYKIWCPGDHYDISVRDEEQAYNEELTYEQRRVNNTHYPYEDTGEGIFELSIRFVSPETFGLDPSLFNQMNIEAVACGIVGYVVGGIPIEHTYMIHVFRTYGDGLELRSRFWPGIALPSADLRQIAINEDVLQGLAFHCAFEYNHLAEFLPEIYNEFKDVADE